VRHAGKVEQVWHPLDLYNRPQNRFVAGFIGSPRMIFIEATVVGRDAQGIALSLKGFQQQPPLRVAAGPNAVAEGDPATVGIRPKHARVVDGDGPGGDYTIGLKVLQVGQLGGHGFVHCELPDASNGMVVQFEGQNVIHAGSEVTIAIPSGIA